MEGVRRFPWVLLLNPKETVTLLTTSDTGVCCLNNWSAWLRLAPGYPSIWTLMSGIIGSLTMFESPIIRIGHFRVSVHRVRNLYFFSLWIYAKCDCCSGLWSCSSWVSGFSMAGGFDSGVKCVLKTTTIIESWVHPQGHFWVFVWGFFLDVNVWVGLVGWISRLV